MAHPRRRSATARSVLAGEASAEAARKSAQSAQDASAPDTGADVEFPVHGDDRAAAFFDLDNTVMQGAAIFHFGRGLYKRKFFETRDLARFAWQQAYSGWPGSRTRSTCRTPATPLCRSSRATVSPS